MDKDQATSLHQQWAAAFRSIGMWHISLDKCARILAIIEENGGNEAFTLAPRFVDDWHTAQDRLVIHGGTEIPPDRLEEVAEGRELLKQYIAELQRSCPVGKPLRDTLPKWAIDIYHEYNLPIIG